MLRTSCDANGAVFRQPERGARRAVSLLLVFWSGLVAGGVHVVTGVDHLAALLPLSVGRRARAFVLGAP